MFVPVVPNTTVINKTVVYSDTVLPLKDIGDNLKITSVDDVSEYSLESCLKTIFKSNPNVVFNTIQYSKNAKKVYFYTNQDITTEAYEESKFTNYKPISSRTEILEEIKEVLVAQKAHAMTEYVAKEATCSEAGNVHYFECSLCEKYYADKEGKNVLEEVVIAAKGHAMTEVEEVKATCGVAGNVHYFECGNCGKYYADKEGKVELTEVIVPDIDLSLLN